MADWGIKISKLGVDVKTATDAQLAFSSKYNVPKTFASDADTIVVSGGSGSKTIAHGLPSTPIALVYIEQVAGDGKRYLLNTVVLSGAHFAYSVDATNLIVNNLDAANGTYNFYYYTFLDAL